MKLLLNLALLAGEGLIRGGTLSVRIEDGGETSCLSVSANGDRFIFSDLLLTALRNELPEEDLEPRSAPAFLCGKLVEELNATLDIVSSETPGIDFRVTIPQDAQ